MQATIISKTGSRTMDFAAFLEELEASDKYRGQIVHVREVSARKARFADPARALAQPISDVLTRRGIQRLYVHQAHAVDIARGRRDVLVVTGTASGKSLCYQIPAIETLIEDPEATALFLFPTKALCQDQFQSMNRLLGEVGLEDALAGVYDGDTPSSLRRRLRESGSLIFSNPDMVHASIMAQHARWADFLSRLKLIVLDEMHVYSGIFGANMANLMRRIWRVCDHYESYPQVIGCSATVANPDELARRIIGRPAEIVDDDGSARGRRTYVLWNPPHERARRWRSRRSANVEAHELMAELIQRGMPTIAFSKAKMTAEMIHRYVCTKLDSEAPDLARKVTPYRGGYLPAERRDIERRLFDGELMGVSTTRALELGIDVGSLDASIVVGYPGTLASFFQQTGRAGRGERDALAVLIGLDTAINQYIMGNPDYLFGRPIEDVVIDPDNPFVITGHLRCAAHELPLAPDEIGSFGRHAMTVIGVLERNRKLRRIGNYWYHAATETPQHEVSLRACDIANVIIQDEQSGETLGEISRGDAEPIVHPQAIYMHQGDTYEVTKLDMERLRCYVKRVEVDYYTQPMGGQDVHHIDHRLREKPFGAGVAYWGEVTAYERTWGFEKIHFYELDAISRHLLDLPTLVLETMAFWLEPPEALMEQVRLAGLDAHSGLRGIGYATRMLLPAFMTCDTLDFSHSIGSANSPWQTIFVFENYLHGLGFTEKAYERLHEIMPRVLDHMRACDCADGCPVCVGKPLRQYASWNVERHEGSVPSRGAAIMILEGLLGDGTNLDNPDTVSLTDSDEAGSLRLEQALQRRLERAREPQVFHPIEPEPRVATLYPAAENEETLDAADAGLRRERRTDFTRKLRSKLARHEPEDRLSPKAPRHRPPPGMSGIHAKPPGWFSGRPAPDDAFHEGEPEAMRPREAEEARETIRHGDSLASKARRINKQRSQAKKHDEDSAT
jgi:DEAD/DEAH box helicase domain-containing protein